MCILSRNLDDGRCVLLQMITLGGDAELELVDSLDPFSEGVVFSVRPPKKSWKNIANLSGGEKVVISFFLVSKHLCIVSIIPAVHLTLLVDVSLLDGKLNSVCARHSAH